MATCPTDVSSYVEEIKTIVFRGIDGITIPKVVRQEAYTLAVDIFIRSIARETYVNYEVMPPEGFYGNATLVMQDSLELKIPVKFPRQRLYYGRVPEAFEQWNSLINFEYMRAYFLALGESLQSLGTALGAGSIPSVFCCSLPEPSWVELPLREVYFHPPIGTQWEIEVSWIRPVAFSDSCDTFYDGYSRQVDGDKDDGLPPNGIFPNVAEDIDNPYEGLPEETPDSEQLGFSNSKSANLEDVDPQNEPEPVGNQTCTITVSAKYKYLESTGSAGSNGTVFYTGNLPAVTVPIGTSFIVDTQSDPNTTTGQKTGIKAVPIGKWVNTDTGVLSDTFLLFTSHDATLTASCVPI
jgi:hypothetical protein